MSLESVSLPIKVVAVLIIWIVPVTGVYYKMDARLEAATIKAERLELLIDKYDPKLLDYRMNTLEAQLNQINVKADRIVNLLNR